MLWKEFCGGTYLALSPVMASDQAVNVYTETREVPGSPKTVWMFGTPGLKFFASVVTAGNRGWWSQDGLTCTVVGNTLYEVDEQAATATSLGTITDDGGPVYFASNGQGGNQLGIVGGGQLKVLTISTRSLSAAVSLPFSNPVMITFLDGYGLINEEDTPKVWFSALENLASWDALDFFARSNTSDNIVGVTVTRDRVVALGSKTTTQFYNSGDADTPFVPYPGTTIQTGLASPALLGVYNDQLIFVAESQKGQRRVVRMVDTQVQDISTPPINRFLAACSTLADAELLIYEQEGHPFIAITAPSSTEAIQTYAYDIRESLWHARAAWDTAGGTYMRWRARGSAAFGGTVFVGDYENGNLYTLDLDYYADDLSATTTEILKRERTAPFPSAENQWLFLDQIELGMQAGVGTGSGEGDEPDVTLEISRDGAQTWIEVGVARLGQLGEYAARAIWRKLGRVRADRLAIRITQTSPVKCVWGPGLWLRLSNGTGNL